MQLERARFQDLHHRQIYITTVGPIIFSSGRQFLGWQIVISEDKLEVSPAKVNIREAFNLDNKKLVNT